MNWMIYGATGYTGRLLAAEARSQGLAPILGGRDGAALAALAADLGLACRVVPLDRPDDLRAALDDVSVVAHCAGPFSATAAPMRAAAVRAKTHYVDITGEIAVFEESHAEHDAARAAGIVLCPGVGFDVIPTDCVAACLKEALPRATQLSLGFATTSGLSRGTALTTIEGLGRGGVVRIDGALRTIPFGGRRRLIDFGDGPVHAAAIPWGDVATAWYTTAIPNIDVYMPLPRAAAAVLRTLDTVRPLLGSRAVRTLLSAQVAKRVTGPDAQARERHRTRVWGEARTAQGERRVARLDTANGYDVTVHGALLAVRHLLAYAGPGGFYTPSRLLGPRCVESLPGSSRITISVD